MADISRAEVATLIEEAYSHVLLDSATAASTALSALPTVNMGTKTTHLPVLATLPTADWVAESATASEGVKPQSEVTWADRTMVAEEIAVIIPVHENVIDDATVSVLDEIARLGGQAIGKKLDEAILFGVDKPASWVSDSLYEAAVGAGQWADYQSGDANEDDIVGSVYQVSKQIAQAGWMPDTLLAGLGLKYDLANTRDANGLPIFRDESLLGYSTYFNRNGAWDDNCTALIVDSSRVRVGVRQDITVKFLDQATVGSINLAERDMVALRLKARFAYVLGTAATSFGANKVPVGAVTDSGS